MADGYHLAQINIARSVAPLTDPAMKGFVDRLDAINALADAAPGFVWRLQSEAGDATAIRAFDDPLIIVNMSVWETLESLYDYVYRSDHREPLRNRRAWFRKLDGPHSAMWWVTAGEIPTVEEGRRRLARLAAEGPGPLAFTYGRIFDPHGRPIPLDATRGERCGV